ncbi:MAG: alpha/beta hydrolase [Proteobacteria bacterium]|nr:alpha/beta hydrolase [Pseudomonadota bacterium]
MTFFSLLRGFFGLLSWLILALSGYLLWSGYERSDEDAPDVRPGLIEEGDEWRMWVGWALLFLSLFGRFIWPLILAKGNGRNDPPIQRGEGRTIQGADGSQIRLEQFGRADGPAIVLTHGWGLDSTVWRYARKDLGERFKLLVWDLPGLGRSGQPGDGRYTLERFGDDLRAVADAAGGPVVLVGHSIGGMTSQTLAGLRPEVLGDKVKGIVLVNTTHMRPSKTTFMSGLVDGLYPVASIFLRLQIPLAPLAWLVKWQSYLSGQAHIATRIGGFGKHVTRGQLEHITRLSTKANPAVEAKGVFAMQGWDITPKLPGVKVPVLVLAGDKDLITKHEAGETIARTIPGARLKTMPGCGHMGFYELPSEYNREIGAFAEEVLGGQADGQARAPVGTASITPVR